MKYHNPAFYDQLDSDFKRASYLYMMAWASRPDLWEGRGERLTLIPPSQVTPQIAAFEEDNVRVYSFTRTHDRYGCWVVMMIPPAPEAQMPIICRHVH